MTTGQSCPAGRAYRFDRLDTEMVTELVDREALTLVDGTLGDSALSFANAAQTTPIDQQTATSNALFSQGVGSVSDAAENASTQQNEATAQNVLSPGSVSYTSRSQYAPVSSTTP
jgi:hypothetical protein